MEELMNKYITFAMVAMLAIAVTPAKAANPFSDCGVGAAIFPTNGAAATISNIIWDAGTTAITSATLSPDTCSSGSADTAKFILETIDNLESDIAMGNGDHVDALAGLMQCESSVGVAAIAAEGYSNFVASDAYQLASKTDKASAFYDTLKAADIQTCKTSL
jgi:hypothetical protein